MNDENKTETVVYTESSPEPEPKTAMAQAVQLAVNKVTESKVWEKR